MGRIRHSNWIACLIAVMLVAGLIFVPGTLSVRADEEAEVQTEALSEPAEDVEEEEEVFLVEEEPSEEYAEEEMTDSEEDVLSEEEQEIPVDSSEEEMIIEATDAETEEIPDESEEEQTVEEAYASEDAQEEPLFTAIQTDPLNGKYSAAIEKGSGNRKVTYKLMLELKNGKFTYSVRTLAESMDFADNETAKGTYTVSGKTIKFTSKTDRIQSAQTGEEDAVTVTGTFSIYLKEKEKVVFEKIPTLLSANDEDDTDDGDDEDGDDVEDDDEEYDPLEDIDLETEDENGLKSGIYCLTTESYSGTSVLKPVIDVILDVENGFFYLRDEEGNDKGSGDFLYDEDLARYTMTYDSEFEDEEETDTRATEFIKTDDGIQFLTPLYIGDGMINTKDLSGNFIPYTAFYSSTTKEAAPTTTGTEDDSEVDYQFTAGANGTFVYGQSRSYTLRVTDRSGGGKEYENFESLEIDDETLDDDSFTASKGSVILVVSADYMKTLAVGNHTITVNFTDGSVSTNLTVSRNSSGSSSTTRTPTPTSTPKTGDPVTVFPYILLMAAAAAGIFAAGRKQKS